MQTEGNICMSSTVHNKDTCVDVFSREVIEIRSRDDLIHVKFSTIQYL